MTTLHYPHKEDSISGVLDVLISQTVQNCPRVHPHNERFSTTEMQLSI